jgi:hypothetical protein
MSEDSVYSAGQTLVYEGLVDNGSYGDSDIYVVPEIQGMWGNSYPRETPDLDQVFKDLQFARVRVTIEVIEPSQDRPPTTATEPH